MAMEAKLDELLASIKDLKETQATNQQEMADKIEKLKKDVYAGQDIAADRVVKRLKQERCVEFKKGHQIQHMQKWAVTCKKTEMYGGLMSNSTIKIVTPSSLSGF